MLGPGWSLADLNRMAADKELYTGTDRKRGCKIVDIAALSSEAGKISGNIIMDAHYSHALPCDLVIAMRCNPGTLIKRMEERGWPAGKIRENVEAEIMEECRMEAVENGKPVIELAADGKTPKEAAMEAIEAVKEFLCGMEPELKTDVKLPAGLRKAFRKPHGRGFRDFAVLMESIKGEKLVSVGDAVTAGLLSAGAKPWLCITDGMEGRRPFSGEAPCYGRVFRVKNPSGTITRGLWDAIKKAGTSKGRSVIRVKGEEDLAVLPCILLYPCGTDIVYGLPGKGAVLVDVSPEKKLECMGLLGRMKPHQ